MQLWLLVVIFRFLVQLFFVECALSEFKGPCETNKLCLCSETRFSCYLVPLMSMPLWGDWGLEGKHLDVTDAPFQVLTESALDGLQLWTLTIAHTNLHTLELGALVPVAKTIYSLDLRKNSIEKFPFKQIGILKKLGALYIDDNNINCFTDEDENEGDWGNLKSTLSSLSLSGNSITYINDNSLSKLSSLRELNLARNRIQIIGTKTFPANLMYLQLDENILDKIPCIVNGELKILHVAKNTIKRISCGNNSNVHTIDLSSNMLDSRNHEELICTKNIKMDFNGLSMLPNLTSNCQIDKLSLSHNKIDTIPGKLILDFQSLKSLSLDYNNLNYLPQEITALINLKVLHLAYNWFKEAPILPQNVRYLSLAGNSLNAIPVQSFQELNALISVDLSNNIISQIESNDFFGWTKHLKEINLQGNQLTQLEDNTFRHVKNLNKLILNYNDISYIEEYGLSNITDNLMDVSLSFNVLGTETFNLQQLNVETLNIDNNKYTELIFEDFKSTSRLKYLDLNFNQIKTMHDFEESTQSYSSMEVLYLSYNYIENISMLPLKSLKLLRDCDLSYNKIKYIQENTFSDMLLLEQIFLKDNLIQLIDTKSFINLPNLRSILLNDNKLEKISLDWFDNVSLSLPEGLTISAKKNKIHTISGESNSHIGFLDLTSNAIKIIPELAFSSVGGSLLELILAYNRVKEIEPIMFKGLKVLQKLDLSYNFLRSIKSNTFHEIESLQILILNHNMISFLGSEVLWNQNNLRFVDLQNNSLTYLPNDLFKNTMIERLKLGNNKLSFYPVTTLLRIGFTLKHLDLSFNSIDFLGDNAFFNTPFIQNLDLKSNKLSISGKSFDNLPNLRNLDLSLNSFNADFKDIFNFIPQLKCLQINELSIVNVPNLPLRNLTVLYLSKNIIKTLKHDDFQTTPFLKRLHLDNNHIQVVNNNVWSNLKKLLYLDLSNNDLLVFQPNIFNHLTQLIWLNLKGSTSRFASDTFEPLKSMKTLHLDYCSAQNGTNLSLLTGLEGLRELNIHLTDEILNNQIKRLRVPKLTTLKITGRKIKSIENNAFESINVEQLHLSLTYTSIRHLPDNLLKDLEKIPSLSLDLSNNKLKSLDPETFYLNETIWQRYGTKVLIGGLKSKKNPMKCGCNNWWVAAWLRRWLRESDDGRSIEKIHEVTCLDENNVEIPIVKAAHISESSLCEYASINSSSEISKQIYMHIFFCFLSLCFHKIFSEQINFFHLI